MLHKDWFRGSKIEGGGMDTQPHRQDGVHISLLLIFKKGK
jgi:hypothetical protein